MAELSIQPTDILRNVTSAIADAARATGSGFDYLLKTAIRESSLDPSVKASTSSATGLFQFINNTWLQTVKEEGPKFGLAAEAAAIEKTADGRFVVRDAATREQILALRNDPKVSAVMAGAFTNKNAAVLQQALGRAPTGGELYIAHFMGVGGATKLLTAATQTPNATAATLFPDAAAANKPIFYDRAGQPRTVAQVYANLVAKHEQTTTTPGTTTPTTVAATPTALTPAAATTVTATQAPYVAPRFTRDTARPVYGLFSVDGTQSPVSPFISDLWGKTAAKTSPNAPVALTTPVTATVSPVAATTPNAVSPMAATTTVAALADTPRGFPFVAMPPRSRQVSPPNAVTAPAATTTTNALGPAATRRVTPSTRASGPPLELAAFRDSVLTAATR